ncbi:MAG: aldehyde dehydrogenase family protein, partial [Planctomycetes bacterium]|nr:aldehyde dehydrogenase family protein [Planctomycetota bacterium]
MPLQPVLIGGEWRPADATSVFRAIDPAAQAQLDEEYPVSSWADCDSALEAAAAASAELRSADAERRAAFLEAYADAIERRAKELAAFAQRETALPAPTRFLRVEIPRTTNQLRQAASAAGEGSWAMAA